MCERTVRTRGQIEQHVLRNQQTRGRHKTEVAQFAACRHVAEVLRTFHRTAEIAPQREGIFNDAQPAEIHACQTHVHLCGIASIQFGRDASFAVDERVACFEVYHCVAAAQCRAEADTAQRKTIVSSFAHLGRRPKIGARRISIEAASFHTEFTRQRPDGLSFEELCQFKLPHIDLRRIVLGVQVHRRASVYVPLALLQGKVCAIVGAGEIHRTEQTHGIRHVEGTRRTLRQQRAHAPGGASGRRVVQVSRALFAQCVAHKAVHLRFHQSRGVERNAFHRQIAQVARECKSHLDEVVFQQSLRHLVDLSAHRGRRVVARNGADIVRRDACVNTGAQRPAAVGLQRCEVHL